MKNEQYKTLLALVLCSSMGSNAAAQITPPPEKPAPSSSVQPEDNAITKAIKRRLESVKYKPKRPKCLAGSSNQPLPDEVEQIFVDGEVSVFAYPNTYACNAPINDKMICDIDEDSLYFFRHGDTIIKMGMVGSGDLKVRFGGPDGFICR